MPHKTIGTFGHNLALRRNEPDVSAETQQRVYENQEGHYRESIPHDWGNQRYTLPGECAKPKRCVGRDEGQELEPGIGSYTNRRRSHHHQENDDEKLQTESRARKVYVADRPTSV